MVKDHVALRELPVCAHDARRRDEPRLEVVEIDGLGQVVVGTGTHRLYAIAFSGMSADEEEVCVRPGVGLSCSPAELHHVDTWHRPVAYDDVGAPFCVSGECVDAARGPTAMATKARDRGAQRDPRVGIVVHDEDVKRHHVGDGLRRVAGSISVSFAFRRGAGHHVGPPRPVQRLCPLERAVAPDPRVLPR